MKAKVLVWWGVFFLGLCPDRVVAQVALVNIGHINNNPVPRSYATDVVLSGSYAYLANLGDGLRVYDVSNPASPINVGHNPNVIPRALALSGDLLLVASELNLSLFSIANPAGPVFVGGTNDSSAASVAVSGSHAYVGTFSFGLRVYDVSNPSHPVRVGQTNNGGHGNGVAVAGNCVYLANDVDGLRVYDVSDPANPVNVGHTNDGGFAVAGGVTVSGSRLYLANSGNVVDSLRIYDISNPTNPVYIGHADTGFQGARGVSVSGNYAYLARDSYGLRVFDVSTPSNAFLVGQIDNGGLAQRVALSGNHALLANYNDGLRVYAVEPQLSISGANSSSLCFSWPATAPFALQENSTLNSSNWLTLTNTPSPVGGADQLVLPAPAGLMLYRLISE